MEDISRLSGGGGCGVSPRESREEASPYLGRRDPEAGGRVSPEEVPGVQPSAFDGVFRRARGIGFKSVFGWSDPIRSWDEESEEEAGGEASAAPGAVWAGRDVVAD